MLRLILQFNFYYLCSLIIHKTMTTSSETIIIVAGGKGERMQTHIPKQFITLLTQPILMHTISLFYSYNKHMRLIVVLPEAEIHSWELLCKKHAFDIPHRCVAGGSTRFESVRTGLQLAPSSGLIGVHDGVRPLVSHETIRRCFDAARQYGACIPVTDPVESIREMKNDSSVAVDRTRYKLVQTPQVFEASLLHKAYEQDYSPLFTDDASVVEATGTPIQLVEGNVENIKITTPFDLKVAELLMKQHN